MYSQLPKESQQYLQYYSPQYPSNTKPKSSLLKIIFIVAIFAAASALGYYLYNKKNKQTDTDIDSDITTKSDTDIDSDITTKSDTDIDSDITTKSDTNIDSDITTQPEPTTTQPITINQKSIEKEMVDYFKIDAIIPHKITKKLPHIYWDIAKNRILSVYPPDCNVSTCVTVIDDTFGKIHEDFRIKRKYKQTIRDPETGKQYIQINEFVDDYVITKKADDKFHLEMTPSKKYSYWYKVFWREHDNIKKEEQLTTWMNSITDSVIKNKITKLKLSTNPISEKDKFYEKLYNIFVENTSFYWDMASKKIQKEIPKDCILKKKCKDEGVTYDDIHLFDNTTSMEEKATIINNLQLVTNERPASLFKK